MTKTIENTDEYIQSLSISELKAWCADTIPVQLNYTQEEIEQSQHILEIVDATDLDYEVVEKILYEPTKATLVDIKTYCKALNINTLAFIEKALS
jgi:hypothetical protein